MIVLIFVSSCGQTKDFSYGARQIFELNSKYDTTMETYPKSAQKIDLMINDFKELRKIQLDTENQPFDYAIDYRILNLEAEKLYIEGQKYGDSGTTNGGFGCKSRPFITESVFLRNSSALKGFEAVDILDVFIRDYPKNALMMNLSLKKSLFLNATFYRISKEAKKDSSIINSFCPQNVTLDLYRQEIKKTTNLSEDEISKLTYEEALTIWKKLREIN